MDNFIQGLRQLPELGVGATYSAALKPLLESHPDIFDVLEIEPQTIWIETPDEEAPYFVSPEALRRIAQLPGRKVVHSIGTPVGGTVRPNPDQLALLKETIAFFESPWISDHLSFNSTPEFATAFFLPPRQTAAGVATVATAVQDLQQSLPVPIAVETGVNYLQPRPDEMPDGLFIASVLAAANCGLLLDLHNIFCNHLNGRQSIDDFLSQIPRERVIELHIAGGFEMDGFWLDAHSGEIPDYLFTIAERVMPTLPNVKALIFEIFPSFIPVVGYDVIRRQIEKLHYLWSLRDVGPPANKPAPVVISPLEADPAADVVPSPAEWERALGALVTGQKAVGPLAEDLAQDEGITIINKLISEFRASMIVTILRLTSRLLMLSVGHEILRLILQDFWNHYPPQQFAAREAENFADFLFTKDLKVPQVLKVLEFERNVLRTLLDGQPRVTEFEFDPLPLFRALAEGRLPDVSGRSGQYEIEVTEEGPVSVTGLDLEAVRQVIPFH